MTDDGKYQIQNVTTGWLSPLLDWKSREAAERAAATMAAVFRFEYRVLPCLTFKDGRNLPATRPWHLHKGYVRPTTLGAAMRCRTETPLFYEQMKEALRAG